MVQVQLAETLTQTTQRQTHKAEACVLVHFMQQPDSEVCLELEGERFEALLLQQLKSFSSGTVLCRILTTTILNLMFVNTSASLVKQLHD